MTFQPFKKAQLATGSGVTDRALHVVQQNTEDAIRQVLGVELLDGVRLDSITAVPAGEAFEHGLGRVPRGWFVVDTTTGGYPSRYAWDDKTITLGIGSGSFTGDVWVF